jgi:glycosyltransferase involved in cell wall biosynthesis
MITKNEEAFLEQCLNSVKNIIDEIIIVDTGSTDNTKNIAKKFCEMRVNSRTRSQLTAKISNFKWQDDFSAAKNESIKHATKDWILVMDADEVIEKSDLTKIKNTVENPRFSGHQKPKGFLVQLKMLKIMLLAFL